MFKIMIVDDEVWVRRGLKEQIDWVNLNAELAAEASDGEEAFDIAVKLRPDILLTDIKMPHMDGIELMKLINANIPDTKVIVISGYSEFDLVKNAMVNKAINYILKPMNEKDLNNAISAAINEIEALRATQEKECNLKIMLNQSIPVLKEKYLNMLVSDNSINDAKLINILAELEIPMGNRFQAIALYFCNYQALLAKNYNNDNTLLDFSITNIIEESLGTSFGFMTSKSLQHHCEHIVLLYHPPLYSTNRENQSAVLKSLVKVSENLKTFLGINSCIGAGAIYDTAKNLHYSYSEARHAVSQLKSNSSSNILFFDSQKKKDIKDDLLDKIVDYIRSNYNHPLSLESVAERFSINPSYLSRIFKSSAGENFVNYLSKIRIEKAKTLMLNKDLKTYEISEIVGYENTHYFSKIFKKATGLSPSEYRNTI